MKDFQSLVRFLRREFSGVRVSVRRIPRGNYWALTTQDGDGKFLVTIHPSLCEGGAIAWLLHEYAHLLSFNMDTHPTMHGPHFGSAYQIVYERYEKWTELQGDPKPKEKA